MADNGTTQEHIEKHNEKGLLEHQFSAVKENATLSVTTLSAAMEIKTLLRKLGTSRVEAVAYDTAWIARLGEIDRELSASALAWLRTHQLPDGSWGTLTPLYYHDRVICTLAAVTALLHNGDPADRARIEAALPPLQHALEHLHLDIADRTIAFEMLLPTLVAEIRSLGVTLHDPDHVLDKMSRLRDKKLAAAPNGLISRYTTIGFSTEMVGYDGLHLLDVENLQQPNGSLSASPAATAFFATYVKPGDSAALQYLHNVSQEGGFPAITAVNIVEYAWALWNFSHAGSLDAETLALCEPWLDAMQATWRAGYGTPMDSNFSVQDGDDTGIVFEVLARFGRTPDIEALLYYEGSEYFHCYRFESGASVSTNIHILGALRHANLGVDAPVVQKVVNFLIRERYEEGYWVDKWHSSPYYPTSHAIVLATGYMDDLVRDAVAWMIRTQKPDGSWGFYTSTAEETAYCLQALLSWHQQGHAVPIETLTRGTRWLMANVKPPYAHLWIGKSLYSLTLVVKSAIWAALRQYEVVFGELPA